ncbi:carboxypeptidase B-like isoform X2 [Rhodnius prolixus]|uniref:carboxypeptidase B-like isoform X2 n=1 Tax=Rhodnius prolixus TaxID=13249 RepID=UPI003D18BE56
MSTMLYLHKPIIKLNKADIQKLRRRRLSSLADHVIFRCSLPCSSGLIAHSRCCLPTSCPYADIKKQNPKIAGTNFRSNFLRAENHSLSWNRFHRYRDIMDYLNYLTHSAPNLISIITIGKSNEGRLLQVAKVTSGKKKNNPAIWVDGGMHGREWIAPTTALFILKQLVENYQTNKGVVDSLDWYIMPLANPDGYEFSHISDRFWRKNRSKKPEDVEYDEYADEARFLWADNEACNGVDLNRNFDYHWGEIGSSNDPCKPNFAGTKPFSEPESRAISEFVMENSDKIKAFITLHSFSQMLLVPWGYTKQIAKDYDDLIFVARKAAEALQKVHGTEYTVGTSPTLFYARSGSSDDWAKGRAGVKYSFTIELRDKGDYGFLLPASQIIPTGRETFAALKSWAEECC